MIRRKRSHIEDYLRSIAREWQGGGAFADTVDSLVPGQETEDHDADNVDDASLVDSVDSDDGFVSANEGPPSPRIARTPAKTPKIVRNIRRGPLPPPAPTPQAPVPSPLKVTKRVQQRVPDAAVRSTPEGHSRAGELIDGTIVYQGRRGGKYTMVNGQMKYLTEMSKKAREMKASK